jgi:hypothetical protein
VRSSHALRSGVVEGRIRRRGRRRSGLEVVLTDVRSARPRIALPHRIWCTRSRPRRLPLCLAPRWLGSRRSARPTVQAARRAGATGRCARRQIGAAASKVHPLLRAGRAARPQTVTVSWLLRRRGPSACCAGARQWRSRRSVWARRLLSAGRRAWRSRALASLRCRGCTSGGGSPRLPARGGRVRHSAWLAALSTRVAPHSSWPSP